MKKITILFLAVFGWVSCNGSEPSEVRFILSHDDGWQFRLMPSGRLVAQYGSTFGDEVSMPEGSIDFSFVVERARTLLVEKKGKTDAQLAIIEDVRSTHRMMYLSEAHFLHEAIFRNWHKWTFGLNGEARLRPLLEKIKKKEPNQSLQTMTTAVTSAASHPPRQLRSCLI